MYVLHMLRSSVNIFIFQSLAYLSSMSNFVKVSFSNKILIPSYSNECLLAKIGVDTAETPRYLQLLKTKRRPTDRERASQSLEVISFIYSFASLGGNGVCDLPCEGDAASTCGGNGMSDMYVGLKIRSTICQISLKFYIRTSGSFSAVSTPIFASKCSFCRIF